MAFIEIERRTNLLALTSFLLSSIAIGNQFFAYVVGAKVELYPPSVIVLSTYPYRTKDKLVNYLVVEADMTYANKGQLGYNDVVKRETVNFVGPSGHDIVLTWLTFFGYSDVNPEKPDELVYSGARSAGPEIIPARSAVSHGTRFVPQNAECQRGAQVDCTRNYIPFDDALFDFLKKRESIDLHFVAELYGDNKRRETSCRIYVNQLPMEEFRRKRWAALNCYPITGT